MAIATATAAYFTHLVNDRLSSHFVCVSFIRYAGLYPASLSLGPAMAESVLLSFYCVHRFPLSAPGFPGRFRNHRLCRASAR